MNHLSCQLYHFLVVLLIHLLLHFITIENLVKICNKTSIIKTSSNIVLHVCKVDKFRRRRHAQGCNILQTYFVDQENINIKTNQLNKQS